jgi:hypothetical protein
VDGGTLVPVGLVEGPVVGHAGNLGWTHGLILADVAANPRNGATPGRKD